MSEMAQQIKDVAYRLLRPVLAPIYQGVGSILVYHHVYDDPPPERVGWPSMIEATSREIEETVTRLRKRGYVFVSMDEAKAAIVRPVRGAPRFVVVTFDDGYASVAEKAYPLLRSLKVPFLLYLTTGFPDRTIVHDWYLLEEALLREKRLRFEHDGVAHDFASHDPRSRQATFDAVATLFRQVDQAGKRALANRIFGEAHVTRRVEELSIDWATVEKLAQDPLVTIGAHTLSHPNLHTLTRAEALHEIRESKRQIEERLGKPVKHFAYPLGSPGEAEEREFELSRECGFETATTTRIANVFPGNAAHLHSLPRIRTGNIETMELQMSGVVSAIRYRGRRVVTA